MNNANRHIRTKPQALAAIAEYKAQLLVRRPDIKDDFAQALATYLVLENLPIEHDAQVSFSVWLHGEKGATELTNWVNGLPND